MPACSACRKSRSRTGPHEPGLVRVTHLAEDLPLARHERVEAGRHAKEVKRRSLAPEAVELDLALGESRARALLRLIGIGVSQVELSPVARREADGLSAVRQALGEPSRGVEIERDALPHLDRSEPVRGADEDEVHAKWLVERPRWRAMTIAKPASAR